MMPPHLRVDHERNVGIVNGVVDRAWVGLEGRPLGLETVSSGLNELLIVEFYSRKL